jgi:hypothetical protein
VRPDKIARIGGVTPRAYAALAAPVLRTATDIQHNKVKNLQYNNTIFILCALLSGASRFLFLAESICDGILGGGSWQAPLFLHGSAIRISRYLCGAQSKAPAITGSMNAHS